MKRHSPWLVALGIVVLVVGVRAASLTYVQDLISTSGPGLDASHVIQFTATQAIPASGQIVVVFQSGAFDIPLTFGVSDVDLAVSSGGPYTDRSLSTTASATEDGVAVSSGSSGSVTITLNSSAGIAAGESVKITLGTAALYEATGDDDIENPTPLGSYRIYLSTKDQFGSLLDRATAMIAIVDQVVGGSLAPVVSPVRFNGLPSGEIAAGNSSIEISLETVESATCRYATSSGVVYGSMTGTFSPSLGTLFYTTISGHEDDTTYDYYVRCTNEGGSPNEDDYTISFFLKEDPGTDTSIAGPGRPSTNGISGNLGPGGVGSYPGGSAVLYMASVTISGWTSPNTTVTILKDGQAGTTVRSGSSGSFEASLAEMERGTYTFQVYSQDGSGRKSAIHSVTLSLTSGTNNTISNIVLSPTIGVLDETVELGTSGAVKGETLPNSGVEVSLIQQLTTSSTTDLKVFHATSSASGIWEYEFDSKLPKGTYYVKARALEKKQADSDFSALVSFAIAQSGASDLALRADINKDGKVNLVDFSILLSNWGGDDPDSDINQDSAINLADFSIQLFHWTG